MFFSYISNLQPKTTESFNQNGKEGRNPYRLTRRRHHEEGQGAGSRHASEAPGLAPTGGRWVSRSSFKIGVYRFYIGFYMFYISFHRFYIGFYRFDELSSQTLPLRFVTGNVIPRTRAAGGSLKAVNAISPFEIRPALSSVI